jgi:hypothetical protein
MANIPISEINHEVVSALGGILWSWEFCKGCVTGKACSASAACSSSRIPAVKRYFQFYEALVLDYLQASSEGHRVLNTHGDIFRSIARLKADPGITYLGFSEVICPIEHPNHSPEAVANAIILVVKVATMIDCSALYQSPDRLEKGTSRICWKGDVPLSKYLQDLFPTQNHHVWTSPHQDNDVLLAMKSELRAPKLVKHLKLKFRPTHDIRNHLRLDLRRNTLEVFHYTSFLKEQLRATKCEGPEMELRTSPG